ncbi:hypothetical protein H9L21_11230 [Aeromicrobium senzhongii]|uniref:AAA family ATPase n=1 Tax=Aeromicrobium senzhongii TaxID=2663859 RepID=A0ABX6SQM6_9ACTN|nr:hypothetical protein [Aeromicrobium senzhongii]MTB89051.1 hypothetical protein [Aeromicrobium senzhongii]QNL93678.1 hypothetical protein H9L21_11230 [Aeromicrobium senzhongii]
MPIRGTYYDILGVTIGNVGGVKDPVHFVFRDGVNALYGLNGAGKTHLLGLVVDALTGNAPDLEGSVMDVHIELRPLRSTFADWESTSVHHLAGSLLRHQQDVVRGLRDHALPYPELDPNEDLVVNALAASMAADLLEADDFARVNPGHTRQDLGSVYAPHKDLVEMAVRARTLTLRAMGRGKWRAKLACPMSNPDARRALREEREAWRHEASLVRSGRPISPDQKLFDASYLAASSLDSVIEEPSSELPVPVDIDLGEVDASLVHLAGDLVSSPDRMDERARELIDWLKDVIATGELLDWGTTDIDPDLLDAFNTYVDGANTLLHRLLPEDLELAFAWGEPSDWFSGRLARWTMAGHALTVASHAQRRWAFFATELAEYMDGLQSDLRPRPPHGKEFGHTPVLLVCDEPEAGLHRSMEANLGTALDNMCRDVGASALVATHSPALLRSPHVSVSFVTRDSANAMVTRPVRLNMADGTVARATADGLGLNVGDLWSLSRVTVVVEGIHDEWVLNGCLSDELSSGSAVILPMHGGTRLRSLAEARALIDYSDAKLLVVLDELDHELVTDVFGRLQEAVAGGNPESRAAVLAELRSLGNSNDSFLFIHQFALRAVELGILDRVEFFGLSQPDIICYLEPASVLSEDESWDRLLDQWRRDAAPQPPRNIKKWLRGKGFLPDDAHLVDEAIEMATMRAARSANLHPDLVALGARILELSS